MPGRLLWWVGGVTSLLGLTALILWLANGDGATASDAQRDNATRVQIATVELHRFTDTVSALGNVRANESVAITSRVSDTLSAIHVDSGDTVNTGDVLFTLDDAEERAALSELEVALADARRESERLERLADTGAVSRSVRDQAVTARQRANAQLEAIRAQLDDREIRAPFDGVVGLRDISPGAYVNAGDVLLRLDDLSRVKLDFTIPERFLSALAPGQRIVAQSAAWPGQRFEGRIEHIDTRVDTATRSVKLRATLPNPESRLRPGMLLTVSVRRADRERPAVPEVAVSRRGELSSVFVAEPLAAQDGEPGGDDGILRVQQRDVELGVRDGRLIEVLDGLEAGERIVVEGMHRIRDGDRVREVDVQEVDLS